MQRVREMLNKNSWIGWVLALVLLALSVFLYRRLSGSNNPYSVARLSEEVTIRCTETDQEWTMNRGEFEQMLQRQAGLLDPAKGIPSPYAEGRATGVLVSKSEWTSTVERINAEKQALLESKKRAAAGGE